jgi:hypothetical protein
MSQEASPAAMRRLVAALDGGYMPDPWADHDFFCLSKRFKRISKSLNRLMV